MLDSLVSILSVDNLKLVVIGVVEKTSSGDEGSIAEVFYKVKNGSSFIKSKSSSKNLSNENKHILCFQRIGILIQVLF